METIMLDESDNSFANRPIASFKPGHGLTVSNWKNRGKDGEFTTTSIETSWKEGEEWKSRKISVAFDALPHLIHSLTEAYREQLLERSQTRGTARAA
jgi:hypothetical protein